MILTNRSLRKLSLPVPFSAVAREYVDNLGVQVLPIGIAHLAIVENLPRHHADPFDRLLIAQSMVEGLTVMTSDSKFNAYSITLAPV